MGCILSDRSKIQNNNNPTGNPVKKAPAGPGCFFIVLPAQAAGQRFSQALTIVVN